MAKNGRNFEKEDKSGEIKKYKGMIRKLEHEIKRLKTELRTYDIAFSKNLEFLSSKSKKYSLEELIDGAKVDATLEEIGERQKFTMTQMIEKWECHECKEGVLKMIIVPNNRYFRKCSLCTNRTEVKELTDSVEE